MAISKSTCHSNFGSFVEFPPNGVLSRFPLQREAALSVRVLILPLHKLACDNQNNGPWEINFAAYRPQWPTGRIAAKITLSAIL
jgi:hypothetical protein